MISYKHKFIFVHAPKTAGNSIQNNLFPYSDDVIKISGDQKQYNCRNQSYLERFEINSSDEKFETHKHTKLNTYYKNWKEKYGSIKDFFKFGTTRNPWDHAISYYFFRGYKSFDKKRFMNTLCKYSCFDYFYVKEYDRNCLDCIVRFENLQEDFDIVCDKIGIPQTQLPHVNKSKHKHYTEYYDDETREIVAEKYQRDIDLFGYKFGE